jgi:hypothetical protein
MWQGNNAARFKILGIETAEEYLAKNQIKQAMRACKAYLRYIELKDKGICEYCPETEQLRWIDDESYLCYACYYEGMQQWGEHYSYHGRAAEDLPGFIYDDEWEYLWEKENGIT